MVNLRFILGQHSRYKELMSKIGDYLPGGYLTKASKGSVVCLVVNKLSDIKIIPFLDKYLVQGVKSADYADLKRAAELMKEKAHLTPEGLARALRLKAGMNTGRDFKSLHPISGVTNSFNVFQMQKRRFHGKAWAFERIGPHSLDVISLIVGSMLGNTHLEKIKIGLGTRIIFEQYNNSVEYLMWFHKFLAARGYCSPNKPKLAKIIAKKNKVLYTYRINSYTFSSFNWLHEMFYKDNIKIIPRNLGDYLTPLALAIWFLNNGSKLGQGAQIALNSWVSREDLKYLCEIIKNKYNIDTTIQSGGKNKGKTLYIKSSSMTTFSKIVKPLKGSLKPYPSIMDKRFYT
jgi:hypothetical protein